MDIVLEDLCKSFDGHVVLDHLSRAFPGGRITCVVGPSGCGKTTLLHVILGLLSPDQGRVLGVPHGPVPTVFQEDRLIEHFCAEANVRLVLPKSFPWDAVRAALNDVGLDGSSPQPVREMSGGMRRRVALVRALLADGPLVLMDEPFKGLDAQTRRKAVDFALPRLRGRTALVVTHDPSEIALLGAERFDLQRKG